MNCFKRIVRAKNRDLAETARLETSIIRFYDRSRPRVRKVNPIKDLWKILNVYGVFCGVSDSWIFEL